MSLSNDNGAPSAVGALMERARQFAHRSWQRTEWARATLREYWTILTSPSRTLSLGFLTIGSAAAGELVSSQQILEALTAQPKPMSLVDRLRLTRSPTFDDRDYALASAQSMPHIDLEVYRNGVQAWLSGGDLYGPLPETSAHIALPFIYPPFAALLMVPLL